MIIIKKKVLIVVLVFVLLFVTLTPALSQPNNQQTEQTVPAEDEGGLLERAIALLVEVPIVVFEYIALRGAKLQSIGELVFNKPSAEVKEEGKQVVGDLPWTANEIKMIQAWYSVLSALIIPFILVIIVINAFRLIASGVNPAMRAEAMETLGRLVGAILIIALAPLLVDVLFRLVGILLYGISQGLVTVSNDLGMQNMSMDTLVNMKFDNIDIKTGSVLGSAIVKVAFLFIFIWFNIVYIIRKISVTIMLCFTPIMAVMWAANKNVNAAAIWAGELVSNAFMPVAHALVLSLILGFTDVKNISEGTWFHVLIYMYTLIPLSEVLRNSMQGLLTRLSGMDEAVTGRSVLAGITGVGGIAGLGR
ncbi:MAG: hypothetical protein M0T74_14405, partial [Desulfitobacterium hafniense]|nr:hypothetical protein [Desulfitobacterium hafniense]